MSLRPRRALVLVGVVVLALTAVLLRQGSDPYEVKLKLADADGLRNGSPVVIGGLHVGTVSLRAHRDDVEVRLAIDDDHAPLPQNLSAAIIAQNILGQKQVQLTLGHGGPAAPSGYLVPPTRVAPTTDLDQLLDTLDTGTRARLTILLNETGAAFLGRRADISATLRDLPPALTDGGALLGQLTRDNTALGSLVDVSDQYVGALAGDRRNLGRLLDRVRGTTDTVAARRQELLQTLRDAPGALVSAQGFLGELQQTTQPLARTARQLSATAPSLERTLAQLEPFRQAAQPALAKANQVAPALVKLAAGATPVLRHTTPVLDALQSLSTHQLPPVSTTLDHSMNNIVGTVENWSRAVQFRDTLGHVFRGEAAISPDLLTSAIDRLTQPAGAKQAQREHAAAPAAPSTAAPASQGRTPSGSSTTVKVPGLIPPVIDKLPPAVKNLVGTVTGAVTTSPPPGTGTTGSAGSSSQDLLDYLLGG